MIMNLKSSITDTKKTDEYFIQVEDVVNSDTQEEFCFLHIDVYRMDKDVFTELKQLLGTFIEGRKTDVCFYSRFPKALKLANSLRPLTVIMDVEAEGIKAKVGIWEYV